jgi:hypothetical protein
VFETPIRWNLGACAALAVPVVIAAAMYARFFGGFWLGDDFANLHRTWIAAQRGELLAQAWAQLASAVPSQGAFYRPLMMGSLSLNQWLAGDRFAGWFAFNYVVHLANVALVAALVARLAAACGRDGRAAGALAAAFLAACPLPAEGVFWVSARADACVTLFTLAGFLLWASPRGKTMVWLGLPLLLLAALGFKESAAVLPIQMLLVALAWPGRPTRGQVVALLAAFAAAAAFLLLRAHLFGSAWQVYPADATAPPLARLWQGMRSLDAWWDGLSRATPAMASAYLVAGVAALALAATSAKGSARTLAAALVIASAGLAAATLLNLGGLDASGEGGRLAYGPVAWLALALGVALSRPGAPSGASDADPRVRAGAMLLLAAATALGGWVLNGELRAALSAQRDVRELTRAAREWADTHAGLTLLVVPERLGSVVATRNGQAGLVLPPVQPQPLLHRVLPSLPGDVELRHGQLAAGLATRLDRLRPATADPEELRRLLEPDAPRWPEHYACWDPASRRILGLAAPEPGERSRWVAALRREIARCRL